LKYIDITTEEDVDQIIVELRDKYKRLASLVLSSEYEATMAGKCVLPLYHRFEPVMKIEGHKEVLDLFVERVQNITENEIHKN
jgi:hypothetical protein